MAEQTYADAVREGRIFLRRRLSERLAVAMIAKAGGFDPEQVASKADALMKQLMILEEHELNGTMGECTAKALAEGREKA